MSEKKNLMTRAAVPASVVKADFKKSFAAGDSVPKKQLTIKLDEARHRKLKVYASERGVTITEVVSEFIDNL